MIHHQNFDGKPAANRVEAGKRPRSSMAGTEAEGWRAALEAKGHQVRLMDMTSGIHAIMLTPSGFLGGADSRGEGVAIGD